MLLDTRTEFANQTTLATPIATAALGNAVDLGPIGSTATKLKLVVVASAAITAASAGTLTFQLVSAASGDLASATVILQRSVATSTTPIPVGTRLLDIEMPKADGRYLGLRQVVAGAALTAGAVSAGLTPASASWAPLAKRS